MRINHIAVNCTDLEALKAFFQKFFKAQAGPDYHNAQTGLRSSMLIFSEGSTRLELMSWPDVSPSIREPHRQGLTHLSLSVGHREDVDSLTRLLKAQGYEVLRNPRTTGDGYYESVVLGPDNLEIELTE